MRRLLPLGRSSVLAPRALIALMRTVAGGEAPAVQSITSEGSPLPVSQGLSPPVRTPAIKAITEFLVANAASAVAAEPTNPDAKSTSISDATAYVNMFVSLINHELRVEKRPTRNRLPSRASRAPKRVLTTTQRQFILGRIIRIVESREVSLVVATRLVKQQWPATMSEDAFRDTHRFLKSSLKAWLTAELNGGKLTPMDARAILANCAVLLQHEDVSIVGSLVTTAMKDLAEVTKPDAIISLMWSVHITGAHAPPHVWRALLERLLVLNKQTNCGLENTIGDDAGDIIDEASSSTPPKDRPAGGGKKVHRHVGHVFSGLTTRQIYRLLEVLKQEKWNGGIGALRDLVDQALKNIVFEVEAAAFVTTKDDITGPSPLTRSAVERRMKAVADLDMEEFVGLLSISGDFGIPFSVSAARVSDDILAPMVRYLDSVQLLQVMQIARQTQCNSASLMNVLASKIEQRGPNAPYTLPLSKAFVRTILKDTDLFPQVNLSGALHFFLRVCDEQCSIVRAEELCSVSDVLYSLSRRFAAESIIGKAIRRTVDLFCSQMNRLLQLDLVPAGYASHLLEHTIVLGMRAEPTLYPSVRGLLETRNVAVERERTRKMQASDRAAERKNELVKPRRWENQSEEELPQLPKTALSVYAELIYMFERMAVVKAVLTYTDFSRFEEAFERAGLYNIFLGAHLMRLGHLQESDALGAGGSPEKDGVTKRGTPRALPGWIERRVYLIVVRKIREAGISEASSDDQVLRVLGQVHCDATKVIHFIELIQGSPLRMLKSQRDVWSYVGELARRFGSHESRAAVGKHLQYAMF